MRKEKPIERSELFITLFREARTRDSYYVAGMKLEIAEQIYQLMERQQVSPAELGVGIGITGVRISRILKGKSNCTLETLVKIGRRLNAEWSFTLVEKTQDEQNKKSEVI